MLGMFEPKSAPSVASDGRLRNIVKQHPEAKESFARLKILRKGNGKNLPAQYQWADIIGYAIGAGWGFVPAQPGRSWGSKSDNPHAESRKKIKDAFSRAINLILKAPEDAVISRAERVVELKHVLKRTLPLGDLFAANVPRNCKRLAHKPFQIGPERRIIVLLAIYFRARSNGADPAWTTIARIVNTAMDYNNRHTGKTIKQIAERTFPLLQSRSSCAAFLRQ